ncbi:uncharacterized protein LOC116336730 [Contarinia nasturtii]|uniref:uncharacterized protein LOC116336730 n=1 Tax=Contarinia nasturtii TaxID=265458 RepID=UPI0012D4502B|nr:uncharacterized protein LOC116336730 [Contarinia nasturtii]
MLRILNVFAIAAIAIVSSEDETNDLTRGIYSFASDLYQESAKSTKGNVIISPFSVANALVLLSQATNRSTFEQLKTGLHLSGDKKSIANQFQEHYGLLERGAGNTTFSIANNIYVQKGYSIKQNLQKVAIDKFQSGIESVNFEDNEETARIINKFVEEKTNRRIIDLIKSDTLGSDSRVVLINAIYFKGEWEQKFYEYSTNKSDFYINETEKVPVDLMNIDEWFNYVDLSDLNASALEMKYADSNFSMVVILPNSRTGLSTLESQMKDCDLKTIVANMSMQKVEIWIPKFEHEFELKLNNVLMNMGIEEIFESNADLSDLLENGESLQVSDVVHKAFIKVSEGGSEAAAATGVQIVLFSGEFGQSKFRADHPFIYYIWDSNSETILFSGRVSSKFWRVLHHMFVFIKFHFVTNYVFYILLLFNFDTFECEPNIYKSGRHSKKMFNLNKSKQLDTMIRSIIVFAIFSLVTSSSVPSTEFVSGISRFSSNLYEQCARAASNENVIISQFSIATAVAFLSQAANGRSFEQIKNCLHFDGNKTEVANQYFSLSEALESDSGDAIFSIANQIYVQQDYKINPDFQKVAIEKFKSGVELVNFANNDVTAKTINHFVEEKTNGKIKDLFDVDSLSPDSRVVLVNAIHFKGDWETKFYETETTKNDFHMSDTKTVSVDFMNIDSHFNYADLPEFDAKALQLQYEKSNFSMVFLLPNARTGLQAMQSKVKDNLVSIVNKMQQRKVEVSIPKFTVEFQLNLNDALQNLGMTDIFADNADLSGLLESKDPVKVSDVVHKAFITVSEGGTEAAAATGVRIVPLSAVLNMPTFRADHPFMYYIVDNLTKTVIFGGQIKKF